MGRQLRYMHGKPIIQQTRQKEFRRFFGAELMISGTHSLRNYQNMTRDDRLEPHRQPNMGKRKGNIDARKFCITFKLTIPALVLYILYDEYINESKTGESWKCENLTQTMWRLEKYLAVVKSIRSKFVATHHRTQCKDQRNTEVSQFLHDGTNFNFPNIYD